MGRRTRWGTLGILIMSMAPVHGESPTGRTIRSPARRGALLIEIVRVGQCRIDPLHELMLCGNSVGSEPWLPEFWQACFRHILFACAGGNFPADKRDRFIQELDKLREVAAIRHFTVPGDDDRVVVDPVEHGGKGMDDSLDVRTADHTGLAEEYVSDSDHIRVRKVNDRVAVGVAVRVMIEFNILSREVNGEHVAKSDDWPSALG